MPPKRTRSAAPGLRGGPGSEQDRSLVCASVEHQPLDPVGEIRSRRLTRPFPHQELENVVVKTAFPVTVALTLSLISCTSNRVDWVDYGADPMQNPQYMTDMMQAGAPGPQHEMLASYVGNWAVDGKMWMAPGTDPMPMVATAKTESLMGGRYIVEAFKSDFMGQPFEGRLVQGYDNITGKFWSMWSDSMSTGYSISHGTETSPGHIEYVGTATDILTPSGRSVRMTTTDNGDGTYTMRMYDTREGTEEFQVMELNYKRS